MKKCMGCMEEFDESVTLCPHCGYEEGTSPLEVYHMAPGSILAGKYIIGKTLGYGGFGVTYIGYDAELERKVAVKEYLPGEFSTRVPGQTRVTVYDGERGEQFQSGIEKFLDEAKRLAKFQNTAGVVHIYDSFLENDTAYIIMEYIEGETLKAKLVREGKMPLEKALEIILPITSALREVHAEGIIHRDIAPDNIMIGSDGKVSLIDFGASRFATTTHSKSLSVLIKPGYAPVEQYQSRGEQGPWTDVYALAATFYTMLTGIVPEDSMERVGKDDLKIPSKAGAKVSKNIDTAIMNAMNLKVEERTASMEAFEKELLSKEEVARLIVKKDKTDVGKWPVWVKVSLGAVALALCVFIGLLSAGIIRFQEGSFKPMVVAGGKTLVPNVVNVTVEMAETNALNQNLEIQIVGREYSDEIPEGMVLAQSIAGGEIVEENAVLELTISAGKEMVFVPSVEGLTQEAAIAMLSESGLTYKIEEVGSSIAIGAIVSQSIAADEKAEKGSEILLQVSKGIEGIDVSVEVSMPDILKMDYVRAQETLAGLSLFIVKESEVYDNTVAKGQIIYQSIPAGNTLHQGDTVKVTVSLGKERKRMPNVQYETEASAKQLLTDAGLLAEVAYENSDLIAQGLVIRQETAADSLVDVGSKVKIIVSSGKAEEDTPVEPQQPVEVPQPTEAPKPTEVPKPTDTPEPTATPQPTDTPEPTATPQPTEAPKPKPTEALKPTEKPKEWSSWVEKLPDGVTANDYDIESKIQYRYKDKTTITSSDASLVDTGWTLEKTDPKYGEYGEWSEWVTTPPEASDTVEVSEPKTEYNYQLYKKETGEGTTVPEGWIQYNSEIKWGTAYESTDGTTSTLRKVVSSNTVPEQKKWVYEYNHYAGWADGKLYTSPGAYTGYTQHLTGQLSTQLTYIGNSSHSTNAAMYSGYTCPQCGADRWYWEYAHEVVASAAYTSYQVQDGYYYYYYQQFVADKESGWGAAKTETDTCKLLETRKLYQYRERSVSYTYTYSQWSDWSAYGDSVIEATDTRMVEKRTLYRYKEK